MLTEIAAIVGIVNTTVLLAEKIGGYLKKSDPYPKLYSAKDDPLADTKTQASN